MDLVNKQIIHKSFGEGKVIKLDDSYIEIKFSSGNKKFVFPDAFKTYLKLNDEKASSKVNGIIREKEREVELKKMEALQREEEQKIILRQEKLIRNTKNNPDAQVVFWCKEHDCDKIFTDWSVFTGTIKSGIKKGQPNRLTRLNQSSACLLTAREPDMQEKDRYIKGVYMVDRNFIGKLCEDGYIPAHLEYRLRLSEEESKKMLFWNYYINKNFPNKITWNSGKYRYFDNTMMAQVLLDIILLKKEPKDQEFAKSFFDYFCQMNQINKEKLPKPNGALICV